VHRRVAARGGRTVGLNVAAPCGTIAPAQMLKTLLSRPTAGDDFYSPVMIGPETLLREASRFTSIRDMLAVLGKLEPDSYTRYLTEYCAEGLRRYPESWYYADICTALLAATRLVGPRTYLEIGVRRGRSMAMVAEAAPEARLLGFDMWLPDYAGMPNPGPDFVRSEMRRTAHRGTLELIGGNSHETVPRFFADNPGLMLDLVTVDGDHSHDGALADLREVIPRLSLGGVLVFDDIVHPEHPYLRDVFRHAVEEDGGLVAGAYTELGYGVAVAVRARPASGPRPLRREAVTRLRSLRRAVGRYSR
jgi:predicted O-methyltransferase YrrM